jgi:transposase InsO family protein
VNFFVVPTAGLQVLFVLVILGHDRRRVLHFNVTESPTAEWTAQQLIEAFPFDLAPRCLMRDSDAKFGDKVRRKLDVMGIRDLVTAPASPWQNAYVERLIGTIRQELPDNVVVLNERHLRRLLKSCVTDYNEWRTHRSLEGDAPDPRLVRPAERAPVIEFPAAADPWRSNLLGSRIETMVWMARGPACRSAGYRRPLASARVSVLLALEESEPWAP